MDPYRLLTRRLPAGIRLTSQALKEGAATFGTEQPQRKESHEENNGEREGCTIQPEK
jgi:hypothetical protein